LDLVVPGAGVPLMDEGAGIAKQTISNHSDLFAFPDLNFGSHK
jgi:hypothetical protein